MTASLRDNPILLRVLAQGIKNDQKINSVLKDRLFVQNGITMKDAYKALGRYGGAKKFTEVVSTEENWDEVIGLPKPLLSERALAMLAKQLESNCLLGPALDHLGNEKPRDVSPLTVIEFIRSTFGSMVYFREHYGIN